jgi:cellobiose phosphorylase
VCKGVKSVTVDGKKVAGNVIPYEAGKKTVKVEITLEA